MGAIGGGIWHSIKGARMAPAGARWAGSLSAVQARSPVLGGQFAVWGGIFACCDCTLTAVRQKEDPWNSIVSGAATGGILAVRAGPRAMASAAVVGGVLLALIEGMGIMFTKMMAPPIPTAEDYEQAMKANDPTAPPTAGGLFPSSLGRRSSGGGGSNTSGGIGSILGVSSSSEETHTTAPPFNMTDETTSFSTEGTTDSDGRQNTSVASSWWPFKGQSK